MSHLQAEDRSSTRLSTIPVDVEKVSAPSVATRARLRDTSQHLWASDSAVWTIEPPLEDATLAVFFKDGPVAYSDSASDFRLPNLN